MVVEDGFVALRGTLAMFRQVIGAVLFVVRRVRWGGQPRRTCPLAIRTYPTDPGINLNGLSRLRNIDFIVNHDIIRSENVVFWVEEGTPTARLAEFSRRGYRWARPSVLAFDPPFLRRRVAEGLRAYLRMRMRLDPRSEVAGGCVTALWRAWLKAHAFADYFEPRAFLHYNDLDYSAVARNLALRAAGCVPIVYMHACNHSIAPSGEWQVSPAVSFLASDHFVSWGKWHSRHVAQGPGKPGEMWELGCLWSEHARLVRQDPRVRRTYVEWIEAYAGLRFSGFQRIIGVFDTSVSSMLSHDDLYYFLAGNLELASKMPKVLYLYKPKYPFAEAESGEPRPLIEAFGSKGRELWKKICAMPNYVVLPRFVETACVVGLADLVISACFTSTTVEALGCRTRAIYYDATDKFPHAFWRRIPGMVCVTGEELSARVHYLLWECADEAYLDYLRTYCMGIEGHFDGRAITRLRQRLLGVMNGQCSATGTGG
jgi:polysaccharide biosynthesis PFTS motif protein